MGVNVFKNSLAIAIIVDAIVAGWMVQWQDFNFSTFQRIEFCAFQGVVITVIKNVAWAFLLRNVKPGSILNEWIFKRTSEF